MGKNGVLFRSDYEAALDSVARAIVSDDWDGAKAELDKLPAPAADRLSVIAFRCGELHKQFKGGELERLQAENSFCCLPSQDQYAVRELRARVQAIEQQPSKRRDNTPTDAQVTLVRAAIRNMGVNNPSREAVAKYLRKQGVRMSNAKIGNALKRLRAK